MKLIDAHCHLQDSRIIAEHARLVQRANSGGIKYMVCCATCAKDWSDVQKLSLEHNSIIPGYGIHPWFVDNLSSTWKEKLINLLESEKTRLEFHSTPGIGEAGLDFTIKGCDRDLQKDILVQQLELAKEMNLPISIHIRKAWDMFIHIIKKIGKLDAQGLIHSYSGSPDMVPLFEKYGFYISFSGSITRPGAKKVARSLGSVSKHRMLVETDSPDICPTRQSNQEENNINTPENLVIIAKAASQIKKITIKECAMTTYNNGVRLFNISEK